MGGAREGGAWCLMGAHVSTGAKLCVAEQMHQAARLRRHRCRRETGKTWRRREGRREGRREDGQTASRQRRRKWAGGRGGAKRCEGDMTEETGGGRLKGEKKERRKE